MSTELLRLPSPTAVAHAAAARCLAALDATRLAGQPFLVALAGGRITRAFYAEIIAQNAGQTARWADVHFFWGDERCVPPEDAESNYRLAAENLLNPLAIPAARIHRIHGEMPPAAAAALATTELRALAPDAAGQPVLDLVLLGMGEDGHIASLFPGESESALDDPAVHRAVTAAKPPPHRITLGHRALAAAREVWVLASGAGKEAALRESLSATGCTPLARLLRARAHTVLFTELPT